MSASHTVLKFFERRGGIKNNNNKNGQRTWKCTWNSINYCIIHCSSLFLLNKWFFYSKMNFILIFNFEIKKKKYFLSLKKNVSHLDFKILSPRKSYTCYRLQCNQWNALPPIVCKYHKKWLAPDRRPNKIACAQINMTLVLGSKNNNFCVCRFYFLAHWAVKLKESECGEQRKTQNIRYLAYIMITRSECSRIRMLTEGTQRLLSLGSSFHFHGHESNCFITS